MPKTVFPFLLFCAFRFAPTGGLKNPLAQKNRGNAVYTIVTKAESS